MTNMHEPTPEPSNTPGFIPHSESTIPTSQFADVERPPAKGQVSLSVSDQGVARVSLGSELDNIVSFSLERMESLREVIASLEKLAVSGRIKGAVFTSDHPRFFCAGADLNALATAKDRETVHGFIREGQELFSQIRKLPIPTVAAIHGDCLGGGLELALSCKAIVATNSPSTKLAFPEVDLGILPGWTGTQTTPRKIGLPAALDIMLAGNKGVDSMKAAKMGLVDNVALPEFLAEVADRYASGAVPIKNRPLSKQKQFLTHNRLGRLIVKHGIPGKEKGVYQILKEKGLTEEQFPAPFRIVESAVYGLRHGIEKGILHEADLEADLAMTPQCKAFTNLFFAMESAKGLGKSTRFDMAGTDALVIGAGVMGAGIGAVLAKVGAKVSLKDLSLEQLEEAKGVVANTVNYSRKLSDEDKAEILSSVEYSQDPAVDSKNLIIEVVPEIMDLKKKILGELSKQVPEDAIIATNTSSLSITEMAEAIKNPERFAGLHFFNPPEKMKLVEIIPGEKTSQETIDKLAAAVLKMGKTPVIAGDVPGFLVNRILMPYLNEAGFLLTEGNSIKDIDKAATTFGMPMGPLRLLDKIGLDTAEHVGEVIHAGYADRMRRPESFTPMIDQGKTGEKGGSGFYNYQGDEPAPSAQVGRSFQRGAPARSNPEAMQERMILAMVNEAVRCLDEGVSVDRGKRGAMQIDLASIFGFGFAPFRGGLIQYAEHLGAKTLLTELRALEECGERFRPAPGIVARAARDLSFYEAITDEE